MTSFVARLWQPFGSLRYRLLALVLVPLLLLAVTVVLFAARWSSNYTYQQLFTKVNTDLRVAHDSFQRIQNEQQRSMNSVAEGSSVQRLIANPKQLNGWVASNRRQHGFDYLMLLNADGSQRLSVSGWVAHQLLHSPLIDRAQRSHAGVNGATGIEIVPAEYWQRGRAE